MAEINLFTEVRRVSPTASIVDLKGDVTSAAEPVLMQAYSDASDETTRAIVFNFSGLEYMNSGGIGMLVTLLVRAQRQKQQLYAFGLNEHYRQIFELTRIDEAIGIHDSEEAALQAAGH